MALKYVFFILSLTCLIMANIANATSRNDCLNNNTKPSYDLATRLKASGGLTDQTDIGLDCCHAIESSPPAMLTSFGFTAEEGNILRGYRDASFALSTSGLASYLLIE
ncbi:hypothetical protein CUMW_270010 [Citrus unshiu]|uniref:Prolamin-like domain-containing protein n=1 Tax=Citrus unshiu TaxID=55188 RepID=A0A2H5QX29_CITUN|nr:hypothetical protein CUMW_270010 [Citrus unshiu]